MNTIFQLVKFFFHYAFYFPFQIQFFMFPFTFGHLIYAGIIISVSIHVIRKLFSFKSGEFESTQSLGSRKLYNVRKVKKW